MITFALIFTVMSNLLPGAFIWDFCRLWSIRLIKKSTCKSVSFIGQGHSLNFDKVHSYLFSNKDPSLTFYRFTLVSDLRPHDPPVNLLQSVILLSPTPD